MATFGTIEPFDMKPGNWLAYEDRIELFLEANSIDDDKKVSTFLSLVGSECYNLVKTLCLPEKPSDKTATELFVVIREHFCPKKIIIAERYRFHIAKQTKKESIAAYVTKLKKLSENCQFGDFLSEMLRDRFVCGLKDQATLHRLLTEEDLTFQSAVSISTSMETVTKDSKELHQPNEQSKGDGPPQKGQFSKGGGPPQQGHFLKGGGPPLQGQFLRGGGPPQQGQFLRGGGPPPQGQFLRGGGPPQQGQFLRGGGPLHQGPFHKDGGPYPLMGSGPLMGGGSYLSGQIYSGDGPYFEPEGSPQKACHHCGKNNHAADACYFQNSKGPECHHCGRYSHAADACYFKNAICTECGKEGHTNDVCRAKGKGGKGHTDNMCRAKGKGDKPKGNPGQQKAGKGQKGRRAQPTKLPYGVEESR